MKVNANEHNQTILAKLIDPYAYLIKYDSSRYSYVSRDRIEFVEQPNFDGMILSVQLNDPTVIQTNMTYLTRGLSWAPRYEVIVIDEQCNNFLLTYEGKFSVFLAATLRALADITNEHERSYDITHGQLITGSIPLASGSLLRVPAAMDTHRVEFMASGGASMGMSPSISTDADASNFGTYSYNLTRQFRLLPKSIKTFPFLSTAISFNSTLEATIYLSSGTYSGLFQRIFTIEPSEFLPAGTVTFYLASTGTTLGQSRLADTSKNSKQRVSLTNDPDVKYQIVNIVTSTRQIPVYGHDLNVTVNVINRKDKQTISVQLTINSGYRNTTLLSELYSSSNISIEQDPINRSILIIRAIIEPNSEEKCSFALKQSN